MEDNLFYIDNNIFTKDTHIYLNLNTSIQKNLNVIETTNLNRLYVDNTTNLKGLVSCNNLYIKENTILNGYVTINNNTIIKYNEDSSHYNNGSLVLYGGLGINKKLNVGNDTELYKREQYENFTLHLSLAKFKDVGQALTALGNIYSSRLRPGFQNYFNNQSNFAKHLNISIN